MKLQNLFQSFIGKNEVLSVFCNPGELYNSVCGFANQIDEKHFICAAISTCGKYDGYVLGKTEDAFRIDYGSYYESSLSKVFMLQCFEHKEILRNNSVLANFIQFAKDSAFVVSISIREYGVSVRGYISESDFDSEILILHVISREKEGELEGFVAVSFDDIYRMSCDSADDRFFQAMNDLAKTGTCSAVPSIPA